MTALERRSPTRRIAFLFKHAGSETGIPSPIEMTQGRIRTTIAIVLAAVTVLVYLPVLHNGFVNYDDPDYILNNPH
ncbi:MAG TPA: hypothetical protein VF480_10550, partial [Verrucomicrobiae bacterium]